MSGYLRDDFNIRHGYGRGKEILDDDAIRELEETELDALAVHLGHACQDLDFLGRALAPAG